MTPLDSNGNPVTTDSVPSYDQLVNKVSKGNVEFLRVAAQDAFAEFLALFKMNGNVWHWSKNYQTNQSEIDSTGTSENAWSSATGLSLTQMNARNNDVLSRGYVVMKFRSDTYLGYFKALSWVMDAARPFQWTFNFTFQVEKTISLMYAPTTPSTTQPQRPVGGV
jgi:hypothetical protein